MRGLGRREALLEARSLMLAWQLALWAVLLRSRPWGGPPATGPQTKVCSGSDFVRQP